MTRPSQSVDLMAALKASLAAGLPSEPTAPVDTITVKQDLGGPYPVYKEITLLLWADGTVTWEPPRKDSK